MKKIILASKSPRRIELLKRIGLTFEVIPANTEECYKSESPQDIAKEIAHCKVINIANQITEDCIIIGADTIVVKDSKVLGKPRNEENAFQMLKFLHNGWHEVVTGISVLDRNTMKTTLDYEITKVKILELSDETIRNYIKTGEPMDKAGAYGIQAIGSILVERIDGCFFNVMGLPIAKLNKILQNNGIFIL